MEHYLTKTDFILFLDCPEELWLSKNMPDLIPAPSPEDRHRMEQGNLIDRLTQQWCEKGWDLNGFAPEQGELVYQFRAEVEQYLAIADIIWLHPHKKQVQIFEVKASTKVKPEHLWDIAFQKMVFEAAGYSVTGAFVVTINNSLSVNGRPQPQEFIQINEVGADIFPYREKVISLAQEAIQLINGPEPAARIPLCSRKLDCAFVQRHFQQLPAYNIFHVSRIHRSKLLQLIEMQIFDIRQIPDSFALSSRQRQQVALAQQPEPLIQREKIREELSQLSYPLYFLDYESISYVIPVQPGWKPYQQMVFQYSLHIQDRPDAQARHTDFLLGDRQESVEDLLQSMQKNILDDGGSIIVWNERFEKARNREMGEQFPEYARFLQEVNDRVYDLMQVFSKGYYQHPEFKGRSSIKSVLPVLCPDLRYDELEISNGSAAAMEWLRMTDPATPEEDRLAIQTHLLKYCHLDTLAMVRILELCQRIN